jgi:hypothetical protein
MGLLRTLLIIVLFFYAFSMIIRLIFNHKMRKLNRKMQQQAEEEMQETPKKPQNPHIDPNLGEYTDFEEVE